MIKALCELFLLENYTRNFAIPIQYFGGSICVVVLLIDKKNTSIKFYTPGSSYSLEGGRLEDTD